MKLKKKASQKNISRVPGKKATLKKLTWGVCMCFPDAWNTACVMLKQPVISGQGEAQGQKPPEHQNLDAAKRCICEMEG